MLNHRFCLVKKKIVNKFIDVVEKWIGRIKARKITIIEIILIFIIGLLPLLWFKQGYFVASGDSFPLFLNPQKAVSTGTYLWSLDVMGQAVSTPAYILYNSIGYSLSYLGLSIGFIQILFQVFFFMGSGFSMYFLSKTIYPELEIAPFVAGIFYMFNFVMLLSLFNVGFIWAYTFLPLLIALLVRVINATYQNDKKKANKFIIYFGVSSTIALSLASITPTNVVLITIGL